MHARKAGKRKLERVRDDIGWFVHIAEPMRLVDDHQVPWDGGNVGGFALRKMIGADDYIRTLEWERCPCFMAALYDFDSRMRQGRKNFSVNS